MPVNLSTNKIKFKNENGNYVTVDVITDDTTESRIAALEAVKSSAISAINEAENDALVNIEDTYASIPEFKNDLSFNEYFINDGKYTIKLSDLEQGQWSYGVKDDSSNKLATRVRNKYLIPVRAGMVISYSNPTFDIYFGILQPRTANNSYIQNSGWKSASALMGAFEILQDGWMTFIMRNPNDTNFSVNLNLADYDCEITIYTASYIDKDILAFDNFLISNGKYTIQASDLEFGQWSFSIKKQVLNSSGENIRARMKYLIPVHKGMKIAYCNSTFDTYFGVLETPTKFSYIQEIGWKTNRYGFINITQNGYMTFIIRNHNDINSEIDLANYDSIITIYTEANNSIEQLESDTSIYENLVNNGQYVIKASDLEVGSWSYSSKEINSTRARMKQLIPVYAGMKITYSNTTFDTYFGILETPTSVSYKQTSGWIIDGNGTYNITNDGWLTFIIRNHADIQANVDPSDFNSVVTIRTTSQNTITSISEQTNNLFDPSKLVGETGVTVNFDKTKIIVTSQSGTYKRANVYLILDANSSYTLSAIKQTISGVSGIYYKESNDGGSTYPGDFSPLISYFDQDGIKNTNTFTTTTGYIQLAFFCTGSTSEQGNAEFSNVMLCKGAVGQPYIPPLTAYDYIARENAMPKLNVHTCNIFKRVLCVGDSYTEGWIKITGTGHVYKDYSWPTYMENMTGNEWINCGVSGASSLTWLSDTKGLASAQSAGVVQAYIVMLMINDALTDSVKIPVGTIDDVGTENPTTYYGAYSKVIRELHAISENAIIFVCTCPYFISIPAGYQQAVRDIAALYASDYNVHLLDMKADEYLFKNESLTGDFINYHYTALGYEQFAEIYNYYISRYINAHIADFQNVCLLPYNTTSN